MVEEAFRLNIKRSLQELSRAIHGDGKTAPNPLFKVKVVLHEKDKVGRNWGSIQKFNTPRSIIKELSQENIYILCTGLILVYIRFVQ